ncbi:phosphate signaling complex PhoU family protein [Euzebya pacifica]|nr:PhoU domain-containing protein [Euzebya pacifica]
MNRDAADEPFAALEGEPPHGRLELQDAMDECDRRLKEVADLVSGAIRPMTEAFLSGDTLTANQLVAADHEIDVRCQALEEMGFVLIARQGPVARDLRRVIAVLRCVNDVLRSGDLLRHVGESLRWIHPPSLNPKLRETVQQLGNISQQLFEGGINAWMAQDALAANELEEADDEVDLLQKVLLTDLYTGEQSVEEAVSLALIARYYERIADHGVEIARQVSFVVTGDRV